MPEMDLPEAEAPNNATPPQKVTENPGSLARVWKRFVKSPGGRYGLALVALFTLAAFLAPFLAHRLPVFWRDQAGGAVSWPLIHEFFAPADTTEANLERGINFLFLFIPLALLLWKGMSHFLPALGRMSSRLIALFFGLVAAAALWLAIGGMVMQGGGKDWFHQEAPPVPEMDDILRPEGLIGELLKNAPTAGSGDAEVNAQAQLAKLHAVVLAEKDNLPAASPDDLRRLLIRPLQETVEGPALTPASGAERPDLPGLSYEKATDPAGDGTVGGAAGFEKARWNRAVLEKMFPETLSPMRQFRTSFLLLVGITLLALLGLTYICLAGAWQFSLTPRWLVLAVAGLLLAQLFTLPPRHDYTPYRELAAAGKGRGVFPLLPYGPNEQGFGPQLPPSWFVESPLLADASLTSPALLLKNLQTLDNPATERLREALARDGGELPQSSGGPSAGDLKPLIAELNRIIEKENLYTPKIGETYRRDQGLRPYVNEMLEGRGLSNRDVQRLNRLIVEKALPGAFQSVASGRWKKPLHTPGYHLLGTDESGRDVLVRIIHGARVSLSVGFVSVFLATVIGLVLGSLAAYYGGKVDLLISRFMEIMMCFPTFFLILAVIAVLDRRSIINIMLVIGLTSWTGVARLIRGEMLRQKKMDYVSASIALGASDTRTIFRHILPNAMAPVLVSISFGITGAILTEAGLSFIGFGVTPPTPTWGQLLSETRDSPLATWWLAVFPGIVLFFSVLAYNLVGEAVRDALDPRASL